MTPRIDFTDDPARVLADAAGFLASEPILHNLVLTLLIARAAHPEPGRYWIARDGGIVFQSPLHMFAIVTPMRGDLVSAMVDAIADTGIALPGVSGDAATAARFAGQWTERTKSAGKPVEGQRIYEVDQVVDEPPVEGRFRRAEESDRELLESWMRGFKRAIGEPEDEASTLVERRLAARHFWFWERDVPVSVAAHTEPAGGVVRLQYVYTPHEQRTRGYAAACVAALSKRMRELGHRCMLYTALENPTSNSIYRRLGYRAVSEGLRYRFH